MAKLVSKTQFPKLVQDVISSNAIFEGMTLDEHALRVVRRQLLVVTTTMEELRESIRQLLALQHADGVTQITGQSLKMGGLIDDVDKTAMEADAAKVAAQLWVIEKIEDVVYDIDGKKGIVRWANTEVPWSQIPMCHRLRFYAKRRRIVEDTFFEV